MAVWDGDDQMKKKDVIMLVAAVAILLVTGYVAYIEVLAPKKTSGAKTSTVTVEKIGVIPAQFDQDAVTQLSDTNQVFDYSPPVDLTGLGNNTPFGP